MFKLPSKVSVYTIGNVIGICREIIESGEDAITIDASRTDYIDPLGLCVLAATVNKFAEGNIQIRIGGIDPNKVIPYWPGVAAYIELKRERLQHINVVTIMRQLSGYAPVKGLKFE